jgi:hypothetical protein
MKSSHRSALSNPHSAEATSVTLGRVSEMTRALGPLLPVPDLIWGTWTVPDTSPKEGPIQQT